MIRMVGPVYTWLLLGVAIAGAGCGSSSGSASNRPPAAVAGADRDAVVGTLVELDGSGSTDPDGDPITYQWTLTSRPGGSLAALSDPAAPRPTFPADIEGEYQLSLIVSDGIAASTADVVVITATRSNARPVARAGADRTVPLGSVVSLDATQSGDPDGDPLTVSWTLTSKPAGSSAGVEDPDAARTGFVADAVGEYRVSLIVDDGRASSEPDEAVYTAVDTNVPPVADAGADQTVPAGSVVEVDGSASSDPDGDPLVYQWSILSKPDGSIAGLKDPGAASTIFVADVEGQFVVQLIVNDGTDASPPDTLVVSVTRANTPPTAVAGSDQSVDVGATVALDGSASTDPDGDPLGYAWSFVARPPTSAATFLDSSTAQTGFVADVAGSYVVQLVVNDGAVASVADVLTVTARNPGGGSGCADPGATLLCDELSGETSGNRDGGSFVSGGGWTPGRSIVWDLGTFLAEGALSADLDNWDPYHTSSQHHYEKQPILNMYEEPHGDNHTADAHGTSLWSIWTGEVFNDLFKFWSTTRGFDESIETRHSPPEGRVDPSVTHHVRVEFARSGDATVFLDGRTVVNHSHPQAFSLRYVFIGSDNSGSNYGPQSGLVYRNIKVWGTTGGGRQVVARLAIDAGGRAIVEDVASPSVGRGLMDLIRGVAPKLALGPGGGWAG